MHVALGYGNEPQLEPPLGVIGEIELVLHPVVLAFCHAPPQDVEHRRLLDARVAIHYRAGYRGALLLSGLVPALRNHGVVDVEVGVVEADDLAAFEEAVQDVSRDLERPFLPIRGAHGVSAAPRERRESRPGARQEIPLEEVAPEPHQAVAFAHRLDAPGGAGGGHCRTRSQSARLGVEPQMLKPHALRILDLGVSRWFLARAVWRASIFFINASRFSVVGSEYCHPSMMEAVAGLQTEILDLVRRL